jgi:hypothetical protein
MRNMLARPIFALHDWLVVKEPLQRLGCYIAFGYNKMKKEWGEK